MRPTVLLSAVFMLVLSSVTALPIALNAPHSSDTMQLSQPSADWAGRGEALRRASSRWAANVEERNWLNQAVEAALAGRVVEEVEERSVGARTGFRIMHDRDVKHR